MSKEDLEYIILILEQLYEENSGRDGIFECFSFIVTLLSNCNPKQFTKAKLSRKFKIEKLEIEVRYGE